MSTATLPDAARLNVALFTLAENFSQQPKMRFGKSTNLAGEEVDALILEGVPVFRSGTFRDSMGFQHTWEPLHMDQMVSHYDLLAQRSIFKDVPVRKGHGALFGDPIDGLIGWHKALYAEERVNPVDSTEYRYLLADYEILDDEAITKINKKLWRNLSAEVGTFLTNNETEFWPVYQGVAYVDIPAVEGLSSFSKHAGVGTKFSVFMPNIEKEAPVGTENNPPPVVNPPQVQPPAQPPAPQMDAAMFARANFTFTIGGRQTQDFAAVQAHITVLETAASEAQTANRQAFIKGLAEGDAPKIFAAQIPQIELYALKLDDEGWKAFTESWGATPAIPHTSEHGKAEQTPGATVLGGNPAPGAAPSEEETLAGIVKHNRRGNMPQKVLETTASFKKLKALNPNHPALTA